MKTGEDVPISALRRSGQFSLQGNPDRAQRFLVSVTAVLVMGISLWSLRAYVHPWYRPGGDEQAACRVQAMGYLGANAHDFTRLALNTQGHMAAGAPVRAGYHTVLDIGGRLTDMGVLPGFPSSRAYSLNARDEIAGCSFRSAGYSYSLRPTRACIWRQGKVEALPMLPGYSCSIARGINVRGQAVGSCYVPHDEMFNAASHAALWEQGRVCDLGVLPGFIQSSALAINDQGQVVGLLQRANHETHGFLWQNGQMQDLGALTGCTTSMATSINNQGQIVGVSGKDPMHLVMWENGKIRDLGTVPGAPMLFPIRINAAGTVLLNAGTGSLRTGDYPRPYLWDKMHGLVRLRTLIGVHSGYFLWRGLDLNDRGQIAAGGRYRAGEMQVYLLTPLAGEK
jgi:probable HAF family extracellular repeat protein